MNSFVYEGLRFTPFRTITGEKSDFRNISKKITDIEITPSNWNYEEFYKVANINGAGEYDLFEINGLIVIPGINYLFEYRGN